MAADEGSHEGLPFDVDLGVQGNPLAGIRTHGLRKFGVDVDFRVHQLSVDDGLIVEAI